MIIKCIPETNLFQKQKRFGLSSIEPIASAFEIVNMLCMFKSELERACPKNLANSIMKVERLKFQENLGKQCFVMMQQIFSNQ